MVDSIKYIEIDGSVGSGGGQLLRTALSLSAILKKPFKIDKIRANRPKPGLFPQHLMCVRAAQKICNAKVEGAKLHSTQLFFEPKGDIKPGRHEFLVKTAGSIGLIIQTVLPILSFAKEESSARITGGTHVTFSPTVSYIDKVFLPAVQKMGIQAELKIKRYGFYPKGGGEVELFVKPAELPLKGINLTKLMNAEDKPKAEILLANLSEHIADREKSIIKEYLSDISVEIKKPAAFSPGNIVFIYKENVGATTLGERGVPAEEVAKKACEEFIEQSKYPLDQHLSDQLLLYMALSKERSEILVHKITEHAKTNIWLIEKFMGRIFDTDGNKIIRKK